MSDTEGIWVKEIKGIEDLTERIEGRYLNQDIVNQETGELIAARDTLVNMDLAEKIVAYLNTLPEAERQVNIRCAVGGNEEFQNRQALAEIRFNRQVNDAAGRVGHQTPLLSPRGH